MGVLVQLLRAGHADAAVVLQVLASAALQGAAPAAALGRHVRSNCTLTAHCARVLQMAAGVVGAVSDVYSITKHHLWSDSR